MCIKKCVSYNYVLWSITRKIVYSSYIGLKLILITICVIKKKIIVPGSRRETRWFEETFTDATRRTEKRLRVTSQRVIRLRQPSNQTFPSPKRRKQGAGLQQRLRRNRSNLRLRQRLRAAAQKHQIAVFGPVAVSNVSQFHSLPSRVRSHQARAASHRNDPHQETAGGETKQKIGIDDKG